MARPVLFRLEARELGFTFETSCMREGYRISKSANFNSSHIMGRSSPIITYADSSSIEVSISFDVVDGIDDNTAGPAQSEQVSDLVQSFLALEFPIKPGTRPPALCTVTLGQELVDWDCVVTRVELQPGNFNLWGDEGNARSAHIGLTLVGVEIENVAAKEYLKLRKYKQLGTSEMTLA